MYTYTHTHIQHTNTHTHISPIKIFYFLMKESLKYI